MDALTRLVTWLLDLFKLPPTTDTPESVPQPLPTPALPATDAPTVDVIARTLWGEARSQGATGMHAVCNVIQNRARNPGWWGHDLRSVCLSPWQFSCWNANDPQAAKMRGPINDDAFTTATELAERAVANMLADLTDGADHYYSEAIKPPSWTYGREPTFVCGEKGSRHFFYKLGLSG